MNQGKSIIKNTLIYAIGNFGSKILAFMLLPLYSFYLSKDEFGVYDLFIVTINLLAPLITLQISDATYRWLIDSNKDKSKQVNIIFNGFFIITIISFIFYFIYFILIQFITIQYYGYFAILLATNLYIPFFQKVLRGLGKNINFAISGIIYTFFLLTLNIIFLTVLNLKIESLFLASIISNTIVLIYILNKINIKTIFLIKNLDKEELKEMIKYSLPLVPNSISWWLINASDKYLILYFISVEANGVYAISTRFPSILMLLNSIFLMAWQDHGLKAKDNNKNSIFFSNLFNKFIVLEMTLVIFLISISPYLIKYLIAPKFIEAWKYLPLLFIGTAFSSFSAYIGVGYQRAKKTKGIFITSVIGGITNLTISLLFLNFIGLYAPALGTVISFLTVYLIRKKQTNSFFKIDVNNYIFLFLFSLSIAYAILINYDNFYIRLLLLITSILLILILNKNLIKQLTTSLLKKITN